VEERIFRHINEGVRGHLFGKISLMKKKVLVSGCFDLLHSGHVEFFRQAAKYGDLYVSLGSDKTLQELKNRVPVNPEKERLFMVQSVRYVKKAYIARGSGVMDFMDVLDLVKPDVFVVNEDGDKPEKRELCRKSGIKYVVLKRKTAKGLPVRCTTELRKGLGI